jgi:hypothetical protein
LYLRVFTKEVGYDTLVGLVGLIALETACARPFRSFRTVFQDARSIEEPTDPQLEEALSSPPASSSSTTLTRQAAGITSPAKL